MSDFDMPEAIADTYQQGYQAGYRDAERQVRDRIAAEQVAYAKQLDQRRDLARQPQSYINGILAAATLARGEVQS